MFLTQEKLRKKIDQDRQRGDLQRAHKRALDGLERWPDDYDLAIEAVQICIDLADFQRAVSIFKTAIRRHPRHKNKTLDFAMQAFAATQNPFLGSFIIEVLMRGQDVDRVRTFLKRSPRPFVQDLIKRSETRMKGRERGDNAHPPPQPDNELLLGLLYIEDDRYADAVDPLGRAMEKSPAYAKQIGSILLEFERDLKDDAGMKFYLGIASALLSHPEKAEARFFQCLACENPPLEKLLRALDTTLETSKNHLLLRGETLIRLGRTAEGASTVAQHISPTGGEPPDEQAVETEAAEERTRKTALAHTRLSLLHAAFPERPEVVMLYAECAAAVERTKEAVDALEALFFTDERQRAEMIPWIESRENIALSAPAQKLLMRMYLSEGDLDRSVRAARMAADMDPAQIPHMLATLEEWDGDEPETYPQILAIIAELRSRAGDTESAGEILAKIRGENLLDAEDLTHLTGEVLKHGGVTLDGVLSIVELSAQSGDASKALPYLVEFVREYPNDHAELAKRMRTFAAGDAARWSLVCGLIDALSEEERLTRELLFVQACAHLESGSIERAVFEFDQLLMLDENIRYDIMRVYEDAVTRHGGNTTLQLALYQIYLEEGQLADAAHHLCRTLEIDPGQIRDVIARFNDLVKREPHNRGIWEEMLKSALAMKHFDLARETLKQAIQTLPEQEAASLHVYGARLSRASGNTEDTLRSLAVALSSPNADIPSVERELNDILKRDPANPQAQYLLGETLFRLGRENEGVSAFEHCLDLSPAYMGNIRTRLEKLLPMSARPWLVSSILGEIAWKEDRHDDALRLFKNAQSGTAEHLSQLGRTLEKLRIETPGDRRLDVLYARNLAFEKRYTDAALFLEELIERDAGLTTFALDTLLEITAAEPSQIEANRLLARTMIRTGQTEKSLTPILRLLAPETGPAETIDTIVEEFAEMHGDNSAFLIPYAALKARCDEYATSIGLYRRSLEIDPARSEEIVGELRPRSWPAEHETACMLLVVDCLIVGERYGEAFDIIEKTAGAGAGAVDDIIARIAAIAERAPERRQYVLCASLLLERGDVDGAGEMIERGCAALETDEVEQLRIEFAETLRSRGHADRAGTVLRAMLENAPDRESMLRRIERTFDAWTSADVAAGVRRVTGGDVPPEEVERYIRTALDRDDTAAALRMLEHGELPAASRAVLAARTYLQMERPYLALAVLGSVASADANGENRAAERRYLEGIAGERIGDYGRATAAFSNVLAATPEYRDCHLRIARNYTRFLESTVNDETAVLEKTGSLSAPLHEGEDRS